MDFFRRGGVVVVAFSRKGGKKKKKNSLFCDHRVGSILRFFVSYISIRFFSYSFFFFFFLLRSLSTSSFEIFHVIVVAFDKNWNFIKRIVIIERPFMIFSIILYVGSFLHAYTWFYCVITALFLTLNSVYY